jgi:pilus assembly protein CpaF
MNTGHEGGCGTLHANSARDVPSRIEALALAAGLNRPAAHSQLASAVDAVVHLTRTDGRRHVAEVGVLRRHDVGDVVVEAAVSFTVDGRADEGPGSDRHAELVG